MQVLQAGQFKLILLELDLDLVLNIARQAGFEVKSEDTARSLVLELSVPGRQAPLLLFDAADQANLGWFSRCQFYVEGRTGVIMQTPMTIGLPGMRSRACTRATVRTASRPQSRAGRGRPWALVAE